MLALWYAQNVRSLLHEVSAHVCRHLFGKCSDSVLLWSLLLFSFFVLLLSRSAEVLLLQKAVATLFSKQIEA